MSLVTNLRRRSATALLAVAGGFSAATLAPPAALAADSQGRFALKGFGRATCAQFVEARDSKQSTYLIMGGWIEGYLTALNYATPDTFDLAWFETTDLLAAMLDNHCRKHPDHVFGRVVRAMVERLHEDRLTEYSKLMVAEADGNRYQLYEETVRRLQRRLQELGLYEGELDGEMNGELSKAINAFQTRNALPATGFPDQVTMLRIFRPVTQDLGTTE